VVVQSGMDGPGRWRRGSWPRSTLSGEASSTGRAIEDISPSGDEMPRGTPSQLLRAVQSSAQLFEQQEGPLDQKGMETQLRQMHNHVTSLTGELSVLHSEVQRLRVLLSSAIQAPQPRDLASRVASAALPAASTAEEPMALAALTAAATTEESVETRYEGLQDFLETVSRLHGEMAAIEDGCGDVLHGLGSRLRKLAQDTTDYARDRAEILGRLDALSQVLTSFEQLLLREVDERTNGDKRLWHALNNHMHTSHTLKVKTPGITLVTASPPLSPSTPRLAMPLASPLLRSSQSTPTLLSPALSRT